MCGAGLNHTGGSFHHFKSEHDHKFAVKTSTFQSLNIHILMLSQFYSFTLYTCALSHCLHSATISHFLTVVHFHPHDTFGGDIFLSLQIQQISTGWSHLVTFTLSTRSFDYGDDDDDVDNIDNDVGDVDDDDDDIFCADDDGKKLQVALESIFLHNPTASLVLLLRWY